jgi:hypothetical protein
MIINRGRQVQGYEILSIRNGLEVTVIGIQAIHIDILAAFME